MNLTWLTARPIAHRGLHDKANGIIENTLSAVRAAVDKGFAIEVDIQLTKDGEAVVHHDEHLGRLNEGSAELKDLTVAELKAVPFHLTTDRIPTLQELYDTVAGRVPLVVELKTLNKPEHDARLTARFVEVTKGYKGEVAGMSFDPFIVAELRRLAPDLPRGITADNARDDKHYGHLSAWQRFSLRHLLHWPKTRPHFCSYCVDHLPTFGPFVLKSVLGRPLITWTVRTPEQRRRTERYADQMTFEGFLP
jgi:glycerophosphoryl diester phosphodiesterase